MYQHFETEFFVGNRRRLRQLFVGTAPIVVTANGVMQRTGETVYPFRQDSNFWYLTGIAEPDIILVIDKTKEYLIIPDHHDVKQTFDGSIDAVSLSQISGIQTVYSSAEGWKKLHSRLRRVKHAATIAAPPAYHEFWGFYTNPARAALIKRIKDANEAIDLLDLRPQLAMMRMVKQPGELAALQQAIDITVNAIKYVQKHSYKTEFDIETALTNQFRKGGSQDHGFPPVISSGVGNTTLHSHSSRGAIGAKELILLDIGAEIENYAADISRTYSQSTTTKRQRDVHAAVIAVQDYALSLIKPGVTIRENEKLVEHFMGEKLRELGLIKIINRDNVRAFFPHATSHYLGLDIHDAGDYDRPLETNTVLVAEPGIYIPKEGIGVRIEDDVLVTKTGNKVLSRRLPRDIS